jgi:hypothetical protein
MLYDIGYGFIYRHLDVIRLLFRQMAFPGYFRNKVCDAGKVRHIA